MTKPGKWPTEFLGRCSHCLDNAMLDQREPCMNRFTGQAVPDYECLVLRIRKAEPHLRQAEEPSS